MWRLRDFKRQLAGLPRAPPRGGERADPARVPKVHRPHLRLRPGQRGRDPQGGGGGAAQAHVRDAVGAEKLGVLVNNGGCVTHFGD